MGNGHGARVGLQLTFCFPNDGRSLSPPSFVLWFRVRNAGLMSRIKGVVNPDSV